MSDNKLIIGKNYGDIFGIKDGAGSAIYNGGISWTVTGDKGSKTLDSQITTDNANKYINQPTYKIGV